MSYGLKIFGVHGKNICCSNVQLVKMHTSSIATNHFYMCSYFCTSILMQLGEEGGIDDQGVSSFTFGTNTYFSPLYLRIDISYALFIRSDTILGQFQPTSHLMKKITFNRETHQVITLLKKMNPIILVCWEHGP
jgi:hypothetical protein